MGQEGDITFIQWLVGQTGLAAVAAFALWMLKKSYDDRLREAREHSEEIKRLYEETRQALDANTRVLAEAIEHLRESVKCPMTSGDYRALLRALKEIGREA